MAYIEGESLSLFTFFARENQHTQGSKLSALSRTSALTIGLVYLTSPLNKTSVSNEAGALRCHSTPKFLSLELI
jgi:hypothetical protein